MSALYIPITRDDQPNLSRLHVVRDGELPASHQRREHARATARAQSWATARTCAALGSVATVFAIAVATIIQAFLAIPNLPLP